MISILLDRIVDNVIAETIDLTHKLDDQSKLKVRNELERDTFELVVPDVDIKLSDLDESLYTKLFTAPISTVWKIHILNNEIAKFRGFINMNFVKRDQNNEYMSITSFSTMKRFWEVAESIRMLQTPTDNGYFSTAEYTTGYWSFLDFFIKGYFKRFRDNHVIQGADFDAGILIRSGIIYHRYTRTPIDTTNEYMMSKKANDMKWAFNQVSIWYLRGTMKDLLLAVAKDNNTEWYIDPVTETLKLAQRNSIKVDLAKDLSDKVLDSDSIDINFSDEKRYKYVSAFVPADSKNVPTLVSLEHSGEARGQADAILALVPGRPYGGYEYILAAVDSNGNIISCGFGLEVGMYAGHSGDNFYYTIPTFTIPALVGLPDVKSRRLYRTCNTPANDLGGASFGDEWYLIHHGGAGAGAEFYNNNFLFVAEFSGNAAVTFRDSETELTFIERAMFAANTGDKNFVLDSNSISGISFYIHYNEATGLWEDPIYESSSSTLDGDIFDTKPKLSFLDSEDNLRDASAEMIYYFFGGLASYENLKSRWKDLMITKRKVPLSMKGNDLNLGDAFTLKNITKLKNINTLIVKKVAEDLIAEESQLELIST